MSTLKADFNKVIGKVKPMHAINNGPCSFGSTKFYETLKPAGIPYARTHDTSGTFGGTYFVDIPNVFPNFDADVNDPNSYDFTFTDWYFERLAEQGVKPFYRLGVTIENYHKIKAYRIYPPKDNKKWAEICEHIVMHYNEGWNNGYHYDIEYWEIWNEPDNEMDIADNPMWKGTKEQFFELYEVASNHLKNRFPNIKVGGYASCGFYDILNTKAEAQANVSTRTEWFIHFFVEFLKYISSEEHKSPLDFFSWHSYSNLQANIKYAEYARKTLDEYGFKDTVHFLNEWNPGIKNRGKLIDASNILGMMIGLHATSLDMLMYYDGRPTSNYCGLWTNAPYPGAVLKGYYAFLYFNKLYALNKQIECSIDDKDVLVMAAANDGKGAINLANMSDEQKIIKLDISNIKCEKLELSLVTETEDNVKKVLDANAQVEIVLKAREIALIEINA